MNNLRILSLGPLRPLSRPTPALPAPSALAPPTLAASVLGPSALAPPALAPALRALTVLTPAVLTLAVLALAVLALAVLTPTPAHAEQDSNRDAVVGFILKDSQGRGCNIDLPGCNDEDLVVSGETDKGYYAYLVIFNGNASTGIAGLELGLRYNAGQGAGVDIFEWKACGDLQFPTPTWPASGSGNIVTWAAGIGNCQKEEPDGAGSGVTAVAGYAYVFAYGDDVLEVTARTAVSIGQLMVADCEGAESPLNPSESAGKVGFSSDGSLKGELPCKTITVEQATWGAIKNVSGSNR